MATRHSQFSTRATLCSGAIVLSLMSVVGFAAEDSAAPATTAQIQAATLLRDAQTARQAGRLAEARKLAEQAQRLAPADPEIRQELALIDAISSGVPTNPGLAPTILTDWAIAEIRQARNRAELMSRAGRPADAAEQLEVVRHAIQQRQLADQPGVAALIATLDQDLARFRREESESGTANAQAKRAQLLDEARERTAHDAERTTAIRDERLNRARDLRARQHLELALGEARLLVDDYPNDSEIRGFYRDLLAETHRQRNLDREHQLDEVREELKERLGRSLLPTGFDGMPIYPTDFTQRHQGGNLITASTEPEWKLALRDILRNRVALEADAQSGTEVLTALAAASHLNLVIDPALAAGGDRPITVHAPSLSLENALTWVCTMMGTRWSLIKGAVWVGATVDADTSDTSVAIYDLAALLTGAMDQPGKQVSYSGGQNGGVATKGGGGGGGAALFVTPTDKPAVPTVEELVDLIKTSISPGIWNKEPNAITIRGNQIYVSAPAETHRLLQEFIRSQEAARTLLVKVDTRWLALQDDFVEEIGVEWTIQNSLLGFPGFASGISKQTDSYEVHGSTSLPLPASAATSAGATASKGLTLSWGLIGPVQLSAVLSAAEHNQRGRVLTGPSVTTVNGVRSNVFIGEETAFISDYQIVSQEMDPVISVLNTGVSLDVKPLVSADHKYVTLDFRPAMTSATFFNDTIVAPRIGLAVQDPLNPGIVLLPLVNYPIELPNLSVREAATTLTIPDRASALIGGLSHDLEQRSESRVPFLGNIPYLGRLFGRRGRYSEHEKLYLLATITIISYDEQEAKL
jgi:tetratricopeptide (TPR) repeat protein